MYIRGFKSTITYFKEPHYCDFEVTSGSTKGQIISEQICGVLNFPKNNEIIARISTLKWVKSKR